MTRLPNPRTVTSEKFEQAKADFLLWIELQKHMQPWEVDPIYNGGRGRMLLMRAPAVKGNGLFFQISNEGRVELGKYMGGVPTFANATLCIDGVLLYSSFDKALSEMLKSSYFGFVIAAVKFQGT